MKKEINIDPGKPVKIYSNSKLNIYWVGITEDIKFRCNSYLIESKESKILIDPGSSRRHFAQVFNRITKLFKAEEINHIIVHHQDPDLCDSLPDWLMINPDILILTTPRTKELLLYYGVEKANYFIVDPRKNTDYKTADIDLTFIPAPFLHFPESFVTYDNNVGYLFSGDIFGASENDWKLFIDDVEDYKNKMESYHIEMMASQKALRGFIARLSNLKINAILPQHGSIIQSQYIKILIDYLYNLKTGLDLIYPD